MFNIKKMKSLVIIVGVIVTTCLSILVSCERHRIELSPVLPELSREALIKRGKYLTTIGGCNDCHSPKVMTTEGPMPDTTRLFSGHPSEEKLNLKADKEWMLFAPGLTAFVGPWGVSYAANLSPDDTGIGNWSFEQFKTAIRKGKYKGLESSRPLLPPMPWQQYRHMLDEGLKAVFTYLKSLPPIDNVVPSAIAPDKI
jgi:hypothetical protein